MTASEIVKALGGSWYGSYGVAPGPNHSQRDRSMKIWDGPGGVMVQSYAGDDWRVCRAWLQRQGLLSADEPRTSRRREMPGPANRANVKVSDDTRRSEHALNIWHNAQPALGTFVETYLAARGITRPIPTSLRFSLLLKHTPSDVMLPAMVAAIQGSDDKISAVHRTYIDPSGDKKAMVFSPKMALGPIRGGAVRLAEAGATLMLVEGIEDGLALMQMTGGTAWALLGTAGFKSFTPPPETRTIILAPDADPAGDGLIIEAAARFSGMRLRVMHLRPPDGLDWCDCLDTYEERAAISEFDGHVDRADAELAVFAELVGGEVRDAA